MPRSDIKWDIGVNTDPLMDGVTGRVGNYVFRTLNNVTVVSRRPRKPARESKGQRDNRERFRLAAQFAKTELRDPEKRKYYEKLLKLRPNLRNAYTVAIKVFMNQKETAVKGVLTGERKSRKIIPLKRSLNLQKELPVQRPAKKREVAVEIYNRSIRRKLRENYVVHQYSGGFLSRFDTSELRNHQIRGQ